MWNKLFVRLLVMPLSPPLDRTHAETLGICAPTRYLAAWYHLVPSGPEFAAALGPEYSAKKPSLGQTHPRSSFCCKMATFGRFMLLHCWRSRPLNNTCCFIEILLTAVATALALHGKNQWFLGFSFFNTAGPWFPPWEPRCLGLSCLLLLSVWQGSLRVLSAPYKG